MKSKAEIIKQFKNHKQITDGGLGGQRRNSDRCDAFYDGDYMNYRGSVYKNGRSSNVQFNKVQPYVNAVAGFMIQTRREANYYPRVTDTELYSQYAQAANALKDYTLNKARANQVESQGDLENLKKGYSATLLAMTYDMGYSTTDPNGEIVLDDITNEVGWDPSARKKNLTDRQWDYYRRSFPLDSAKTLFGSDDEDDYADVSDSSGLNSFTIDPDNYPYSYPRTYDWDSKPDKTVWVYFYEWYELETFYRADNPLTVMTNPYAAQVAMERMQEIAAEVEQEDGLFKFDPTAEILTFDSEVKSKLEELFEDFIEPVKMRRKVFYTAVLSGEKCFDAYRSQSQNGFAVTFKTGIWNNTRKIWTGMINPMMEPTEYSNKALTEFMYLIAANSKGGWFAETDATDDVVAFENDVNSTNAIVWLTPGALSQGKVQPKAKQFAPSGYDSIIAISDQAVSDASGVDPNFIKQQSGQGNMTAQLHRQLIKQVTSTLAPYFDAREHFKEDQSRLLLDYLKIYAENNKGRLIRIAGEAGAEGFMQISMDPFSAEYDIEIEESPETEEERQEQVALLTAMGDKLLAVGDTSGKILYGMAVKTMRLDEDDKQEIMQVLSPQQDDPRIAQYEQKIQALTSEQTKISLENLQANTNLTLAKIKTEAANVQKSAAQVADLASDIDQKTIETNIAAQAIAPKVSVSL